MKTEEEVAKTEKEPKVIPIVDDWFLGADNYCLILYRRKKVTGGGNGGKQVKQENIGTYTYNAVGYYTTLDGVFDALGRTHMRETINKAKTKTMEDLMDEMVKFSKRIKEIDDVMIAALRKGKKDE